MQNTLITKIWEYLSSKLIIRSFKSIAIAVVTLLSMAAIGQTDQRISNGADMFNDHGLSKLEIVLRMSLDVSRGNSYLQLNERDNQRAMEILQASYMADAQRQASEHFYDAFCVEMESSNPDVLVAGRIFDQAASAEVLALEDIYDAVIAELPNDKFSNLENLLANTTGSTSPTASKEAEARANPVEAKARFLRMCSRIRNPLPESANSQVFRVSIDK